MKNLVNCRICSYIVLTIVILCVPVAWAQSVKTIDGFAEIPLDIYKSKTPNSPTVVYAHGCSGYDNFDFQKARLIRSWGYNVVVMEYTRGRGLSNNTDASGRNITCVKGWSVYPIQQRADDFIAVGNWILKQDWHVGKVAAIGFSLGGGAVEHLINDSRDINPYSAGVAFYPYCRFTQLPNEKTLPNQFHIGTLDESYYRCLHFNSVDQRHNFFVYENATHAFDNNWGFRNSNGYTYDKESTRKSFEQVKIFFDNILKTN
jgi:dienelactone hydrolase